jgi:membrane fusion protein (multidrug efflux system)
LAGCSADSNSPAKSSKPQRRDSTHLVEVSDVKQQTLSYAFERSGTLRALREARIISQEEGAVLRVLAREGDDVATGAVLVRLDDRVLAAELDKAVAKRKQFESDVKRLQRLRKKNLSSEEALTKAKTDLQIAAAEERLLETRHDYMTIKAPFAGTIAERLVNAGDVATKHQHLMTLVDSSSLVTVVSVSELLLPGLQVGDEVVVSIDALGKRGLPGAISRIYPTIDPKTRRGKLEVVLEQVPASARAGQFCRVIITSRRMNAITIPLAALRRDEQGEYVFVVDAEQQIDRRGIRTGLRLSDSVEVISGVNAGERVVTSGFLGLREGQKVKPVTTKAALRVTPGG